MIEENPDWQVFTQLAKAELDKLKASWQELSKGMTLQYQQTITPAEFFKLVKAHALQTGLALQFAHTHSPEYAAQLRTFVPGNRLDEVDNLRQENEKIRQNFFYLQKHAVSRVLYEQTQTELKSVQFLASIACSGTFYYNARCEELEAEVKALKDKLHQIDPRIDLTTLSPPAILEPPEDMSYINRLLDKPDEESSELLPPYETGFVSLPVQPPTATNQPDAFFQPAPPPPPRLWPVIIPQHNFDIYYSDAISRWNKLISQNKPLDEVCRAMFDQSTSKEHLNSRIVINQITLCHSADPLDLCLLMDKELKENTFIENDIAVKNQVDFCRQMLFRQFGPSSTAKSLSQ